MNAAEIRALLYLRKLQYEDFAGSLPGIPELDGQLGILELPASEFVHAEKLAKGKDGDTDESLTLGAYVTKGLISRETKERIFQDTEIEAVAAFGPSILMPIVRRIKTISGMDDIAKSIEDAKKNSNQTPSSGTATALRVS